ncbi:hypothetical protein ONZ45_g7350 [Pleurotus djamor]|nr:hypothetical protein ONZ45_g7350 [Pleurotus djamor]
MNLRRILGTHIITCVLSAHAFPIVLADEGSTELNAHVYDSVPDFSRLGNSKASVRYDYPVRDVVYPFDRRALSLGKAQREKPKKTPPAQALAPISPPKGKPAVPAPAAPNRKPPPAPLPNKQSTLLPAAVPKDLAPPLLVPISLEHHYNSVLPQLSPPVDIDAGMAC